MSKHTPGPWHSVDYCGYFNIQREPYYDSGNENLLNMEECDEAQANGKLCAAAPELLEALKKISNWELPATGKFWDKEEKQPMSYEAAYGSNGVRDYIKSIAKEAIKKATT